ncbi:bifunctional Ribosomal protein L24e-related/Ribosomal protein L24e-L24 superfamily [Babesia duncani]|uniref:Bifunctional Ribosomal protein L24e-related/Ribosomal protein L24e-L24 superfamily n=1 Tax=Babesia duncani TaxID=323732 RepID=A0AAD9UPN3_9APIC|nr:bifunctional Ribosomal protein L24e-related/Ribosomal protein L24e-L24 superfamily [Babesia duncani]
MASVTTTIKTELCSFTDYRVYPGRGQKFVARDGKVYFFLNSKAKNLHKQRVKPARVRWTTSWRKANKKFQTEVAHRRRNRKNIKVQKPIVGLSLDELKSRRATATKTDAKMSVKQAMQTQKLKRQSAPKTQTPKVAPPKHVKGKPVQARY